MAKRRPANAFTLGEMLFVLLIVVLFGSLLQTAPKPASAGLTLRQIQSRAVALQMEAFETKQRKSFSIGANSAAFDGERLVFPKELTCTPASFAFNGAGNISKAGSVSCQVSGKTRRLVFQLGSGRSRLE